MARDDVPPRAPPVALVTGASSGLGAAYARGLAARGYDLLLAARREERLRSLAAELAAAHGSRATVVVADLATDEGRSRCRDAVDALPAGVAVAVLNAGILSRGPLWELDAAREVAMVELNCVAVVDMALHLVPGMVARGSGDVVVMSSAAATTAMPYMATYAATKAFGARFATALGEELRGTGVRVVAVLPGPTRTELSIAAGSVGPPPGTPMMDPDKVVKATWSALERGRPEISVGAVARLATLAARLLPRRLSLRAIGRAARRTR